MNTSNRTPLGRNVASPVSGPFASARNFVPAIATSVFASVRLSRSFDPGGAHENDAPHAIEAEDRAEASPELVDVVAQPALAERAEVRQVLADLRGRRMPARRELFA